jgi:hypothetical protein
MCWKVEHKKGKWANYVNPLFTRLLRRCVRSPDCCLRQAARSPERLLRSSIGSKARFLDLDGIAVYHPDNKAYYLKRVRDFLIRSKGYYSV